MYREIPESDSSFTHIDRTRLCAELLKQYRSQKVLLIGIGGGGDIIGTLPTYFDLLRIGAQPILAGLAWKRVEHDPAGRPRTINEFQNATIINESIALVNAETNLGSGIQHIEADLAKYLPGTPILSLDCTKGIGKTRTNLAHYLQSSGIEHVIAVDVGGDALCLGNEHTIRSPLADQIMLGTLAGIPKTILGVFGLGSDGELPMDSFIGRFRTISKAGGFIGALDMNPADIKETLNILQGAKTECSLIPVKVCTALPQATAAEARDLLNGLSPKPELLLADVQEVKLRSGTRTGELSAMTAFTLYFDLRTVYQTNMFSQFIDEQMDVHKLNKVLLEKGYITEFKDQEIRLKASSQLQH